MIHLFDSPKDRAFPHFFFLAGCLTHTKINLGMASYFKLCLRNAHVVYITFKKIDLVFVIFRYS